LPNVTAEAVLQIVQEVCSELHPEMGEVRTATLDSGLDRDLGFDSLGRAELLTRLERVFQVRLSEDLLADADTPADLMNAIVAAGGAPLASMGPGERVAASRTISAVPEHATTLQEVLTWHGAMHGERVHIVLMDELGAEREISYGALHDRATAMAAGFLALGVDPGQPVAIMLPTGADYFSCFMGILLAGGIPVPIYPPARPSQLEDHLRRHVGILTNARCIMLVTVAEARMTARLLGSHVASLRRVATADEIERAGSPGLATGRAREQDVCLLQYTSGSTGNPKGVVLNHANVLANIRAMGQAAAVSSADVFVSWLPLYHDMGLIGAWLGSLYHACRFVVMSPFTFLARPERWLWAIHRHRGTLSAAPNFGYELCLRRIEDAALEGLDLSSWRMAFNGAEVVSPDTMSRFADRFAKHGLKPEALAPVYGLAECSVGLAFPPVGRGLLVDTISREALATSGQAVPATGGPGEALRVVACGQPLPGHQVRIVDGTGHEVGERVEGRLEFKGPSATSGYRDNPEQTRQLFHDGWLDSGDYAYISRGDIYITGRAKDIIIRGGRNIYPQELEEAVGNIAGIRKGCVAAFGSLDPRSGTERIVILAETRETEAETLARIREKVNEVADALTGIPPDDIVLAPPHTVLKTSSGKIRRAASRELYERGLRRGRPQAVWWQLTRLTWNALLPELRRALRAIGEGLYAAYGWVLFWLLGPLTWLAAVLLPRPKWAWKVSHWGARTFVLLSGTPMTVSGLEHIPRAGPCVLAANHGSYLDGIILVAVLPHQFAFVAKRELGDQFIPGAYLTHLGARFVERYDSRQGIESAEELVRVLQQGSSAIFFPEGTFTRVPGLRSFRMGAFVAAARADVPVIPVTLRGTRSILRADHWFPRRGAIAVTFGPPIQPQGPDWAAALQVRDLVRGDILQRCGEPDVSAFPDQEAEAAERPHA
jgi:1-acyl-sn-glycerol-3-phosphate acyltransferase